MDVAKYIGLFLLKHNFCYIPGLGNLEIKRKPANYTGDVLNAPSLEVLVTPGGSIDDSLANFIATNEKISIASASNAMRNFADNAKILLQEDKEVIIPSLGKFIMQNGRMQFITDPHLKQAPAAIPAVKQTVSTPEPTPQPATTTTQPQFSKYNTAPSKPVSTNWGNIIIVSAIILLVLGGIGYGIYYMSQRPDEAVTTTEPQAEQPKQEVVTTPDTATNTAATPDTNATTTAAAPATVSANGMMNAKVIINIYLKEKADKRVKQLTTYGNTVEMIQKDSILYYVVMPVSFLPNDSTKVVDSLRRKFNPTGRDIVRILH